MPFSVAQPPSTLMRVEQAYCACYGPLEDIENHQWNCSYDSEILESFSSSRKKPVIVKQDIGQTGLSPGFTDLSVATLGMSKGPHTRNGNCIQSSESQVNLCMYWVIVLPKVVDFDRI